MVKGKVRTLEERIEQGSGERLEGMKSICEHMKRSEATMLKLIRTRGFPAAKIGGVWESDTGLIAEWRITVIRREAGGNARKAG